MITIFRLPPPLLSGIRLLLASVANITHFEYAIRAIWAAPLPADPFESSAFANITNWGQFLGLVASCLLSGVWQLIKAGWAHPQDTAVVAWWLWECLDLKRSIALVLGKARARFGRR